MDTEQDLDRNHAATPHKINEARQRGQVAKSVEVVSASVFAVAAVYLHGHAWDMLSRHFILDRLLLSQLDQWGGASFNVWPLIRDALWASFSILGPLLAAIVVSAILSNFSQTGAVLSITPLGPDWKRLDPAAGLKRLFGLRTLFDGLRASLKLIVLATVLYFSLKSFVSQFQHLSAMTTHAFGKTLVQDAAELGLRLCMAFLIIAALDWIYTRREFSKKLMMSARELKNEVRQREGDPRIRSRLRELRRELLKRSRTLRRTKDADVLITNPTHLAVALRYRHGEMAAPLVVGKGRGATAAAMREIAASQRIPVIQNVSLARALYASTEIEQHVPSDLYASVARLMVWLLAMKDTRQGARPSQPAVG